MVTPVNNKDKILLSLVLAITVLLLPAFSFARCESSGVQLQVLGSGGPFGGGSRASSGYLVWIDGVARVMVDAGGGTFLRFHEAGAALADLDILAISHLHPDHSAEIPALYWVQGVSNPIAGPSASDDLPSITEFMERLFQSDEAAFRVLGTLRDSPVIEVDVAWQSPTLVFDNEDYSVRAIGVPHGPLPTLGYRIDIGDRSIAFASDQTGTNPAFTEMIRDVDVLVAHFAAARDTNSQLHARPSVWAQMAVDAKVGTLVLSHISTADEADPRYPRMSGADLDGNVAVVRETYQGPVTVAQDLMCVSLD